LKGTLANALKITLSAEDRAVLEEFMNTLPKEGVGAGE